MTATILDKIVMEKRLEVEEKKRSLPMSSLEARITQRQRPRDFTSVLRGDKIRLIAEVKKASPSKGILCSDFNPVALAKTYEQSGAAAISVLTEVNNFQGNIEHLTAIREKVSVPLLRKDFIFDPYQIYESAAYGADALLLIGAILTQEQLEELLALSHRLDLSCLVEVHNENELEKALLVGTKIIGINNRDLSTFNVDINTTRRLCSLIPEGQIVVSESGIRDTNDIIKLEGWGVDAVLVGEALVTAGNILAKMDELLR